MDITIAPHTVEEWFFRRTISADTLKQFSITWDADGRITIPVHSPSGTFLFNKYRRSPFSEEGPKYRYDKGATSALYGAQFIENSHPVIVCEGELDVLALRSHAFPAVSSTGGAGTFDPRWADILKGHRVIICYDNDDAGHRGALNVQSILPDATIALLPDKRNVKDITDYFMWLRDQGELDSKVSKMFDAGVSYPMEEFEIPEKKKDMQILKRKYLDRIEWAYKLRSQLGMHSTKFVDTYIEQQQQLVADVARTIKRGKYKPGNEKSIPAAKAVPITNYMKFDRQGFAKCLWHNEDTPSLHYILKSNKVYCFGACQKAYDVIDVVMAQRNITFAEALDAVLNGK